MDKYAAKKFQFTLLLSMVLVGGAILAIEETNAIERMIVTGAAMARARVLAPWAGTRPWRTRLLRPCYL